MIYTADEIFYLTSFGLAYYIAVLLISFIGIVILFSKLRRFSCCFAFASLFLGFVIPEIIPLEKYNHTEYSVIFYDNSFQNIMLASEDIQVIKIKENTYTIIGNVPLWSDKWDKYKSTVVKNKNFNSTSIENQQSTSIVEITDFNNLKLEIEAYGLALIFVGFIVFIIVCLPKLIYFLVSEFYKKWTFIIKQEKDVSYFKKYFQDHDILVYSINYYQTPYGNVNIVRLQTNKLITFKKIKQIVSDLGGYSLKRGYPNKICNLYVV